MSYLDESGLSTYDSNLKEWVSSQESKTITSSIYPWTKTAKTGAVSCYPVGGTELKPVVDFLFTETPPASGEKGPENPSTVMGASSVNVGRVGKNLLLKVASTQTVGTIAMTPQSDGSYIINGTASGNVNIAITDCGPEFGTPVYSSVRLNVNKNYTLTATILEGSISGTISVAFGYGSASGQYVNFNFTNGVASYTFNSSHFPDGLFIARIRAIAGASFSNAKIVFQLEEGDTTTAFEAPMLPADANHDIPLGSTYYGGTLDVATGVMTVTHTVYDIGESMTNYSTSNAVFYFDSPIANTATSPTCESFAFNQVALSSLANGKFRYQLDSSIPQGSIRWLFKATDYSDVESFSAAFAGKKLVYRLATPYTVQLSPTQILSLSQADKYTPRLNTIYTDASAVQVGYVKSPIRDEYELQQAIVAQGGEI